jgi:hypothetical protein
MNTAQLIEWMKDPASLGKDAGAQLDSITQKFPYFQTGQLLLIKSLHNQNSFLYNNQLKVAAAYATNRKVLYELITKKSSEVRSTSGGPKFELKAVNEAVVDETKQELNVSSQNSESKIKHPEFPKKRFVTKEDEWESGMLRQLQLLHHWQVKPGDELKKKEPPAKEPVIPISTEEIKTTDTVQEPTAADEINTLLYVLVEPDGSEDLSEESVVEENNSSETVSETENKTDWQVDLVEETETTGPVSVIEITKDPIQQTYLANVISSSIGLEVSDTLPSLEEIQPSFTKKEPEIPVLEAQTVPETIENNENPVEIPDLSESSFAGWLKQLSKQKPLVSEPILGDIVKTEKEVEAKPQTALIEDFIKNQPRIKGQKNAFYSPVNMAKKSVQESDEFVTETLARIYAKQGNIPKAVRTYQKLSLKFPEKTAYFAALIEELKRTPNK